MMALHLVTSILLVLVYFCVAGIAVFRFKTTAAGISLTLGYAGFGLLVLGTVIVSRLMHFEETSAMVYRSVINLSDLATTILVAAGIALIPRSLRKIRDSKAQGR
jgi:hypothetical protein